MLAHDRFIDTHFAKDTAMYQRILVPTDGSDITMKALETAIGLAKVFGAEVYTLAVKDPYPYSAITEMQPTPPQAFYDIQERIATQHVLAVKTRCAEAGVSAHAHTVEAVHPYEAIVDHAKLQGCDLIVMASHGRRGMQALLLGSETQKVLTHSRIPVLVVR